MHEHTKSVIGRLRRDKPVNKNVNQAGQDNAHASASSKVTSAKLSEDAGYDDSPIPYVPLPDDPTRHTGLSWRKAVSSAYPQTEDTDTSPTTMKTESIIVLSGVILGAGLGALLAYLSKGDSMAWAFAGAGIGGVIALMLYLNSLGEVSWEFMEGLFIALPDMFNCCIVSAILMIGSITAISGLLLTHNWTMVGIAAGCLFMLLLLGRLKPGRSPLTRKQHILLCQRECASESRGAA